MEQRPKVEEASTEFPEDSWDNGSSFSSEYPSQPSPWRSRKRFWVVATIMGAIMLALIPIVHNGSIALPDEAVYMAQAEALTEGSWEINRPAPDFDIKGEMDPLVPSSINGDKRIPYHRHPLYSLTLVPGYWIGGLWGLFTTSVVAGWIAAVLIGLIARRINASYGIPSMLLAGLGSPLLFSSFLVVAQPIAAALAAGLILSCFVATLDRRSWAFVPLTAAAFLLPCYRSEGAVFIGAAAISLAVMALAARKHGGTLRVRVILSGLAIGIAGTAGYLVDMFAARSVANYGNSFYTNPAKAIGGEQVSILNGVWGGLFKPWYSTLDATAWLPVVMLLILVGAFSMRLRPRLEFIPATLFSVAALSGVAFLITNMSLVPGLFAAMPVLLLIFVALHRGQFVSITTLFLTLLSASCGLLLAVTIYGDGGSGQWGGRLFQVILPALIPLSVLGVCTSIRNLSPPTKRLIVGALIIVSMALSASSLRINRGMRTSNQEMTEQIVNLVTRVRSNEGLERDQMLVFFSEEPPSGGTRALWQQDVELNLHVVGFKSLYSIFTENDFGKYKAVLVISNVVPQASEVLNRKLEREHGIVVHKFRSQNPSIADGDLYLNLPSNQ